MIHASHLLEQKDPTIYSIGPDESVLEAIQRMAANHIGALLVMDGDRLVGVLSERDYARKVILKERSSRDTRVRDIMTSPVVTVAPRDSVDHCMRLVTAERVRYLPVLDAGRVLGVLSIGDLVKSVIDEQAREIEQLQNYIAS